MLIAWMQRRANCTNIAEDAAEELKLQQFTARRCASRGVDTAGAAERNQRLIDNSNWKSGKRVQRAPSVAQILDRSPNRTRGASVKWQRMITKSHLQFSLDCSLPHTLFCETKHGRASQRNY